MYNPIALSPMVPCSDVERARSFFVDYLGFEIVEDDLQYSIVKNKSFTVHLQKGSDDPNQMSFYLHVDHLNDLLSDFQKPYVGFKGKGPIDQPYGMLELHVIVPGTNALLFIGQSRVV